MKKSVLLFLLFSSVIFAQPVLRPGQVFQGNFNLHQAQDYEGDKVIWHTLNVTRGQNLLVRAEAESDSKMYAILPNGLTFSNDDTFALNPAIFIINQSGQVRIGFAYLESSATGPYKIFVENIPSATNITGTSIRGSLNSRSPKIAEYPIQIYQINLSANQPMIFLVESEFDNKLIVIDPQGNSFNDDDSGGGTNARIQLNSPVGGMAYLIVMGYSADSEGDFNLKAMTPPPPAPIAVGRTIRGKITGNEVVTGYVVDAYSSNVTGVEFILTPQTGRIYSIFLESEEFDTFLEVKQGETVRSDDDGGGGTNSKIIFESQSTQPIYIFVRPLEQGTTGAYRLTVSEARVLQTFEGTLTTASPKDISGKYYGIHDFRGTPNQKITIRLSSDEFDSYLIVQDSQGNRLADNDDEDGGSNSAVSVQIPSNGVIKIFATNYGNEILTGKYRIRILAE